MNNWKGERSEPRGRTGNEPHLHDMPIFTLHAIGRVSSSLTNRLEAPKQGNEGAPNAWLEFKVEFEDALRDLRVGEDILVLTWLHQADRQTLRVHPRDDLAVATRGVF